MHIEKYQLKASEGYVLQFKNRIVQLLDAVEEDDNINIYAVVSDKYKEKEVAIAAIGDGWPMEDWLYLNSVKAKGIVWHIFFTVDFDRCDKNLH